MNLAAKYTNMGTILAEGGNSHGYNIKGRFGMSTVT